MSRDSSHTYIHTHSSRHADLFEEFCRPPSASFPTTSTSTNGTGNPSHQPSATSNPSGFNVNDNSNMAQLPGSFLPFEEISLPPHLVPVNPEDEDDVVPDMHAAFSINRALGQHQAGTTSVTITGTGAGAGEGGGGETSNAGTQREPVWRDLGLNALVAEGNGKTNGAGEGRGARREGHRTNLLLLR
ncbi:hypothetical protein LTS15_008432 [Exophiala xenobiotica]|nr:hypothetical protein LTS15_008432 [Exophiala xenobiotica]